MSKGSFKNTDEYFYKSLIIEEYLRSQLHKINRPDFSHNESTSEIKENVLQKLINPVSKKISGVIK